MKSILLVCIGNICRSPMAEGLFSKELAGLTIESAGIGALIGHPADPAAVQLMAGLGVDISKHRARQINQDMCRRAEIILVMDLEQRRYIETRYPFCRGKVFRLTESFKVDVPDPYGQSVKFFESSLGLIKQGAEEWIRRINKIIEKERQVS